MWYAEKNEAAKYVTLHSAAIFAGSRIESIPGVFIGYTVRNNPSPTILQRHSGKLLPGKFRPAKLNCAILLLFCTGSSPLHPGFFTFSVPRLSFACPSLIPLPSHGRQVLTALNDDSDASVARKQCGGLLRDLRFQLPLFTTAG